MFDDVIIVDWSAAATPRRGKDSIWIAHANHRTAVVEHLVNLPTRTAARDWLVAVLDRLLGQGRRIMIGVDFSLGYPRGFAEILHRAVGEGAADLSAATVRRVVSAHIVDHISNANNRFEVANAVNAASATAMFWGRPAHRTALTSLGTTLAVPEGLAPNPLERFRRTEVVSGQRLATNWQLLGVGSVGSQVLMGLPVIDALVRRFDAAVWPFDPHEDSAVVIAETWPGLFAVGQPDGEVRDAWQVRSTAQRLAGFTEEEWQRSFSPPSLLSLSDEERAVVTREEGWMFGVR
jgi:precorrin-8X/cobalt-precorrin-8 methylmutase